MDPIVLYGIPNIILIIALIIIVSVGTTEVGPSTYNIGSILAYVGGIWAMIAAPVITVKKKTFLTVGEPEASVTTVSVYGNTAHGKTSAAYSGKQWFKVFINIRLLHDIRLYLLARHNFLFHPSHQDRRYFFQAQEAHHVSLIEAYPSLSWTP